MFLWKAPMIGLKHLQHQYIQFTQSALATSDRRVSGNKKLLNHSIFKLRNKYLRNKKKDSFPSRFSKMCYKYTKYYRSLLTNLRKSLTVRWFECWLTKHLFVCNKRQDFLWLVNRIGLIWFIRINRFNCKASNDHRWEKKARQLWL